MMPLVPNGKKYYSSIGCSLAYIHACQVSDKLSLKVPVRFGWKRPERRVASQWIIIGSQASRETTKSRHEGVRAGWVAVRGHEIG